MAFSQRERILAVYRGETPDTVPYMLDLSHWFYHRYQWPWDLSQANHAPEEDLIACHASLGAGFYLPNLAAFIDTRFEEDIRATTVKSADGRAITWRFETPRGAIERTRQWEDSTYAWGIPAWGLRTEDELGILADALCARRYVPHWERYRAWVDRVGPNGVVYAILGYSAWGHLLNLWMGIEGLVNAMVEWPDTLRETVDRINANTLDAISLLAESPAEVILLGDNFSSDLQPPALFNEWSRAYYAEAVRRIHDAGKYAAVHVDGRMRGLLEVFRDLGFDAIDAVTPAPMGDLTPAQCRCEAGPRLILSGGVSPNCWLPDVPDAQFDAAVIEWLELKRVSPRLIANAGDQVPPHATPERITRMRDLVQTYGRY